MIKNIYRYENLDGFGPFYEQHRDKFILNNCRCGCLSYDSLISWFSKNSAGAQAPNNYRVIKYVVDIPDKSLSFVHNGRIFFVGDILDELSEIYFNLDWVKSKEVVNEW